MILITTFVSQSTSDLKPYLINNCPVKENNKFFLRNIWYYALSSSELKLGKIVAKKLLGEPILFGRTLTGQIFALRDICPHRAIPLSYGNFDGKEIECCYHGWRFSSQGKCTVIPALVADQKLNLERFQVKQYPVKEIQGNIWIYMIAEAKKLARSATMAIPKIGNFPDRPPNLVVKMNFPCYLDYAIVGLMDPTHLPFVHRSRWWKSDPTLVEEVKKFVPLEYGFSMAKHKIVKVPEIYRLLGTEPETEINFYLPGIRIENLTTKKHTVSNLTTVTPISETETEVYTMLYWDFSLLNLLKPIIKILTREFLAQDRDVVVKQQIGLQYNPSLMLIKDADTQASWYYKLKADFAQATIEGEEFINPLKEQILKWRC